MRAQMLGNLDTCRPNRSRCAIDQHRVTGLDLRLVHEKIVGCCCAERDCGGLFKADVVGFAHKLAISGHDNELRMCAQTCTGEPDHRIARLVMRNVITDRFDHA